MEIYVHNFALSEDEIVQISRAGIEPAVHLTSTMETAHAAVTIYSDLNTLLEKRGTKKKGLPLKIFPIPVIVMCTRDELPECHGQYDFGEMNAIPTLREAGNHGLVTILTNLSINISKI